MTQADLIEALQTIHDELESGEDLDPVEVNKLRETVREIEAALARHASESKPLGERVNESALHFEQSHPRLTLTLGRIADMLQQMGI
jgi:Domain of unknown function (DUF4404)